MNRTALALFTASLFVVPRAHAQEITTILAAQVTPSVAPGAPLKITYNWRAARLDRDFSVFVHIANPAGTTVSQGDHAPPVATSAWSGPLSYSRIVDVPATWAEGDYKVFAGLYAAKPNGGGWENAALAVGPNVVAREGNSYHIATIRVRTDAPPPPVDSAGPATLDLKNYKLTFADEFADVSVSERGPNGAGGTRWMAHTPYWGDFGDAPFANPEPGFPFTARDGMLRIEAKKGARGWRAGLLSSADPQGNGFSQRYGYFEMRAKFPTGPGTWPAFWMQAVEPLRDPSKDGTELDIVEQYGHAPQVLHATHHFWPGKGKDPKNHTAEGQAFIVPDMTAGFHRYGLEWNDKTMTWYFDGVALWSRPTPLHARRPMYLLVNLALGGGWPIENTPNPRHMMVDYVRAYARVAQ